MADVIMPQMGESIAEGTVTRWLKNVGDQVERDEPLFEISTDKVDAEIPSPAAGVLKEIRVAPGTTVPVNTIVAVIAGPSEAARPAPNAPPPPPPPDTPPVVFEIEGETPETSAEPLLQEPLLPELHVPEPQATPEPSSDAEPLSDLGPPASGPEPAPAAEGQAPQSRAEMSAEELRLSRSSPVVRKIAAEHHVDIREIPGTGIGGRVTKQDILGHIEGHGASQAAPQAQATTQEPAATPQADGTTGPQPAASTPETPAPPAPKPPFTDARAQVVPMSPIRRRTAEHMLLSKRTSAHVTTVFEIDMSRVAQLRDSHRRSFEERGARLTWMPFILKAVVDALKTHPVLNASIDGESVVYHKDVNLGLAVALDWGLIVPVIKNAEEKNVLGLARAAGDLAERARQKKLRIEEVQGGTFTVTNPGGFGSLFGTPIINQPQVAILDVGAIEKRAVVRDDAIAIRTMAYFALTFDHRLVDGADADRFLALVKTTLQDFDEAAL